MTNGTNKSTANTFRHDAYDSPRPHAHRLRRRAADRQRAAAARQAARDADRARRMSEAAVKRSDLANFDPATPLEKLGWGREMRRNFRQPMSARAIRVCTVCSERWDTA